MCTVLKITWNLVIWSLTRRCYAPTKDWARLFLLLRGPVPYTFNLKGRGHSNSTYVILVSLNRLICVCVRVLITVERWTEPHLRGDHPPGDRPQFHPHPLKPQTIPQSWALARTSSTPVDLQPSLGREAEEGGFLDGDGGSPIEDSQTGALLGQDDGNASIPATPTSHLPRQRPHLAGNSMVDLLASMLLLIVLIWCVYQCMSKMLRQSVTCYIHKSSQNWYSELSEFLPLRQKYVL